MPTTQENLATWGERYAWDADGDEWSKPWGGPDAQWYGSLYPRVHHFLPTSTVLEIAPGHGRWTHYLASMCDRLIVVDLAPECIDACRQRFVGLSHLEYHVNDGRSLDMLPAGSIDFAFSFDSLVHAEDDVIGEYLRGLKRAFGEHGVGFIHHSNLGNHRAQFEREAAMPEDERRRLFEDGRPPSTHWRAASMSSDRFVALCREAGLICTGQEIVSWGGVRPIDCISVFTQPGSRFEKETVVKTNPSFLAEIRSIRAAAAVYGPAPADP